jgi:hypothetical protein
MSEGVRVELEGSNIGVTLAAIILMNLEGVRI